ncbi:MAG: hypothetical protein HY015_00450 [Bacteroidetes bacterium]|nr:hypothetical protein [Bacteroidota bacterium]MBI3481447.1 hypothetical protein [Bacteroidota bacterium]
MRNSKNILIILFILVITQCRGQYRVFISAGFTQSYGGNVNTFLKASPAAWTADVEVDRKVFGSLHLVSGLSSYGVGYSSTKNIFGPANSNYEGRFLAVPIMARWNLGNRNFYYIDFGIVASYLVQAKLTESLDKFKNGNLIVYSGDIAPHLNRFFQVAKFQQTFVFNRFLISIFFIFEFKGQNTLKDLSGHWGLNAQQSTFINSNGYSDFYAYGFKMGCRIR